MTTPHEIYIILIMMTFGLVIPIWMIRPLWEKQSGVLVKIGLFSIILGLVVGGVAPVYLKTSAQTHFLCMVIGATIFFSFGLANLITYYWGDAGYAVSLACFSWFVHSLVIPRLSPEPIFTKGFVVFCLIVAAAFFVNSLDVSRKKPKEKPKKGKIVIAVLGGLITAVKFTIILFDMLK